ncbi:MAG TPA: TlyA family RNA methyltransferase [Mycobacteriales bacterium]|nr:TlyA family RNA methyltransferase [Mycobacteriales bacterium]
MATKTRLDAELVRRGLARSREHARELVDAGQVRIGGIVATKPATGVGADASVTVAEAGAGYVSRGATKLAGALDALGGPAVAERDCLDAGASTGGFTDVLLRRGARSVAAVDVGYGQLAWRLRTDPRVEVHERTNVRDLTPERIGRRVDLVVADLSFISLRLALPALSAVAGDDADQLLMVKPQFEAGREAVGRGGVVRDASVRADSVSAVAAAALALGWGTRGVVASSLPGPAGNVEYFLWLRKDAPVPDQSEIARAVAEGPS